MLGGRTLKSVREMGRMVTFIIFALYNILVNPGKPFHVLKQIHFIGAKSTFVIFLTAAFTGRAGSAITAEIGIMKITEQIDALRTMALEPFKYLVSPKVLASIIAVPLLCAIFDVVGIFGGYLIGVKLLGV